MTMIAAILTFLVLLLDPAFADNQAQPFHLEPYKDELFAYQRILQSDYEGAYLRVEYDRPRDLYARDVEPGDKVDPKYVSLEIQAVEADLALTIGAQTIRYVGVGATEGNAKGIVLFIHGRGTDRFSGVNDWIHGGNFNRIKNLMVLNGGAYLSPGAPIFLACGSWGGKICWRLVDDPDVGPLLAGIIFLDARMDRDFVEKAKRLDPDRRLPIHISNSQGDRLIGWRRQRRFFERIKTAVPDYPIRFVLFSAGTHGISLRMTDWRQAINWMVAAREGAPQ